MKKVFATGRAFTLIELLVVIAIIAILTGIVLTSLTSSKAKARDAQRVSDLGQIQLALELYFDRCHQYPVSLTTDSSSNCTTNNGTVNLGNYISVIPTSPLPGSYLYINNSQTAPTDYILHTTLETQNNAQQNSLPESLVDSGGADNLWAGSVSCYNSSDPTSKDYCVGPK